MYLEGVGIRKQGLDVGKVQACLRLWRLMPAVCTNEVQCQTGLNVGKLDACIKVWQPTDEVCRRKYREIRAYKYSINT